MFFRYFQDFLGVFVFWQISPNGGHVTNHFSLLIYIWNNINFVVQRNKNLPTSLLNVTEHTMAKLNKNKTFLQEENKGRRFMHAGETFSPD